ncbi:MAG: CHASE2 domain-containing protein [Pseudomonadota bacterium]
MTKFPKQLLRIFVIAIFATAVAWGASHLKAARDLEEMTFDIRVLAFSPETKPSPDIVMIWLDEATMKGLPYRTPIPRDFLATLHSNILKAKPWLIAYDIFFKDPSFPKADSEFAKALEMGAAYGIVPRRPDGVVDMPLALFMEALAGVGLADLPFNPFDATVRMAKLGFDTDRGEMDSFAAMIFKAATGIDAATSIKEQNNAPGWGPLKTTPYTGKDKLIIRFAGPPGKIGDPNNAFKTYSASLVKKGLIPDAWLKDKIVMVGASYQDLKDAYLTPYYAKVTNYARMPGVEIHANVLSSLITNQLYYTLAPWQGWAWSFVIALIVSIAVVLASPWRATFAYILTVAAASVACILMFRLSAVTIPMISPLIGATASFGAGLGWRALTEGKQKRFIKSAFAKYVPHAVVERMTENPQLLKLGGETRQITSLFTDIASFTTISERMDPEELVAFLNDYLGKMNEVLFSYGATLDKYEGDAIIAFFNAPLDVANHELCAVKAALGIKRASAEITKQWGERCGRDIITRAGINSGSAVVGNMGSLGRFDYTAIGDTINLASRLEGANKFYNTTIMASEQTVSRLGDEIMVRPLDKVRVRGKTKPIFLYEIFGVSDEVEAKVISELVSPYKKAFELFEKRRAEDAKSLLSKILENFANDGPSQKLIARCERLIKEPEWDLVTDLETK